MRFLKLITSRIMIVTLSILAQAGLMMFMIYVLENNNFYVQIAVSSLCLLLFFFVVSREEPASFKLPWIILILLFPFAGLTIHIMFGNIKMTKKTYRRLTALFDESSKVLNQNNVIFDKLKDESIEAYGQATYINNTAYMPVYNDTNVHYLNSGEAFFSELKKQLSDAKEYIFLEYFIIEKGKMWDEIFKILQEKIAQGVKVYLIYDDIGSMSKVPNNFYKKLREFGIIAIKFNPYKPVISAIYNNRDHRKIAVIDGAKGFVSGANIADEYINEVERFGKWKDGAVYLEGKAVNNLVIMFIQLFNSTKEYQLDFSLFIRENSKVTKEDLGYVQPFGDGPRPFYKNYIGESVYLNMIGQAKKYLYITTPYLIVDYHFMLSLKNAAKRGVDVRIITPHIPDKKLIHLMTKYNYASLINAGVKIYEYEPGFIHSKVFLCDDQYAVVGTINLDYRSLVHHYECGVWMYKTGCISQIKDDFNYMFTKETIEITMEKAKLKWYQLILHNILNILAPLM